MVCLYLLGLDAEGRGSAEPDFLCMTGRVIGIRAYVNIDCAGHTVADDDWVPVGNTQVRGPPPFPTRRRRLSLRPCSAAGFSPLPLRHGAARRAGYFPPHHRAVLGVPRQRAASGALLRSPCLLGVGSPRAALGAGCCARQIPLRGGARAA